MSLLCAVLCLVAQLWLTLRPHRLQPARLLCPWGFSRQEYWSGLPCPPPEVSMSYHQRIDAFKLWCWSRLLRVPWTASRSNSSILRKSNPEYSLEGLMLKLKLEYFGHLMQTVNSLEKSLMLGKDWGHKKVSEDVMAGWHHWCNGHRCWANFGRWWGRGRPAVLQSMGSQRVRHNWVTE